MPATRPVSRRDVRAAARVTTFVVAALAACGDATVGTDVTVPGARQLGDAPTSAPDIRGTVTAVTVGDSMVPAPHQGNPNIPVSCPPSCAPPARVLRTVLVEEIPESRTRGDKSVVTVLRGVPVLRRIGSGVAIGAFDSLRVGQRVSAWFDGPVLESYPSQARARVLVIER